MSYNNENVCEDDYVKLKLCDGYYKVTEVHDDYIDLVDSFGSQTDARYEDIKELRLNGEVPGTNF